MKKPYTYTYKDKFGIEASGTINDIVGKLYISENTLWWRAKTGYATLTKGKGYFVLYDEFGKELMRATSMNEAAEKSGYNRCTISECIRHRRRMRDYCFWKYEREVL